MTELFPSYAEIRQALMCLIYFKGGALHSSEAYEPLADYFNLSNHARTISRGEYFGRDNHPQSAWHCLVQWGRRDLKKAGYLDPNAPTGIWKLTEQGKYQASLLSSIYYELCPSPPLDSIQPLIQKTPEIIDLNKTKGSLLESALYPSPSQLAILDTPQAADFNEPEGPTRLEYKAYRILRDTTLAREIKAMYHYKCQICSNVLELSDGTPYAEAHHIKPLSSSHNGPDIRENILCVCPNHHVLLDYGAIKLDISQLQICSGHNVGSIYISYHNTYIFGRPKGAG